MDYRDMEVADEVCPAYTDLWNNLKQTLDEDMQRDDLNKAIFLMKDKLDQEFLPMLDIEMPSELLTYLENNMPLSNAVSAIKHVLAAMQYHTEFDQTNLSQTIQTFEKSLRRILIEQNIGTDDRFIGRGREMKQVEEALLGTKYKCIWIHGNGGLGKTTLAKEVCAKLCLEHETRSWKIINVDLKQTTDAKDALRTLLAQLHSSSTSNDFTTMMQEVKFALTQELDDAVIVLLDNVEEVFDADKVKVTADKMQSVLDNLLSVCDGVVGNKMLKYIVTSRSVHSDASHQQRQSEIMELELRPLEREHARKLILTSCKHLRRNKEKLSSILAMCGNVPLALRLVCNAIRAMPHILDSDSEPQEIRHVLQNGMSDCVRYAFKNIDSCKQTHLEMLAVYETSPFDVADAAAVLDIPESEATVRLMHFCHRNILEQHDVGEGHHNVVKRNKGTNRTGYTYSFHPLVWSFLRNQSKSEMILKAHERFVLHMFKKIDLNCEGFRENYATALSFVNQTRRNIKTMFRILSERGQVLTDHRLIRDQLTDNKYLVNVYTEVIHSHRERIETMSKFVNSLEVRHDAAYCLWKLEEVKCQIDLKEYDCARSALNEIILKVTELAVDKFRFIIAEFYYTKGRLERFCDNVTQSFDCFEKSLELFEKCQPVSHYVVKIADVLNGKGTAFYDRKDFDKSLYYHQRALALVNEHKLDFPTKYNYIFNIGAVAFEKAKVANDEDVRQELFSLSLSRLNESMEHDAKLGLNEIPQHANKLRFRWKVFLRLKEYKKAVEDAETALKIRRKHDDVHPEITKACYDTAFVYMKWGKDAQDQGASRECLRHALRYFKEMETAVRDGGLPCVDDTNLQIMDHYKAAAEMSMNKKYIKDVEKFVEEFRTGTLRASSSSDDLSTEDSEEDNDTSEGDSDASDNMEVDEEWRRRDSGFTESFSSSEVTSAQARGRESAAVNPFFPPRSQSVISDDVFLDTCRQDEIRRASLKRRRSDSLSD